MLVRLSIEAIKLVYCLSGNSCSRKFNFSNRCKAIQIINALGMEIGVIYCSGLNKNGPHRLIYLSAWSPGVTLFDRIRKIRRCGIVGASVSLRVGFDVSEACAMARVSLVQQIRI